MYGPYGGAGAGAVYNPRTVRMRAVRHGPYGGRAVAQAWNPMPAHAGKPGKAETSTETGGRATCSVATTGPTRLTSRITRRARPRAPFAATRAQPQHELEPPAARPLASAPAVTFTRDTTATSIAGRTPDPGSSGTTADGARHKGPHSPASSAGLFGARPGRPAHERLQLVPAFAVDGACRELRRRRRFPRRRGLPAAATLIKAQVTRRKSQHKSQGHKSQGTRHKAQTPTPNSQFPTPKRRLGVGELEV